MIADRCCQAPARERGQRTGSARGLIDGLAAIISGAALVLMPKCPACLAGYLALGTGIGFSISSAGEMRSALIAIFTALLVFSTARTLRRLSSKPVRSVSQD